VRGKDTGFWAWFEEDPMRKDRGVTIIPLSLISDMPDICNIEF